MDTTTTTTRAAQTIAPEDLRVGDHVALLQVSYEYPSFLWCGESALGDRSPVQLAFLPFRDVGQPLDVKAICLPFVVVQDVKRNRFGIDIRTCRLGRLDDEYVQAMRTKKRKKKKSKKK